MDRPDVHARLRLVSFAAVTTLLAIAPTAYAAYISGSVTLFADFLRSTMECFAIVLSWFVLRHMAYGDVSKFHYGFGKFEQIASLVVAGALLCTFIVCLFSGIQRYFHPEPLDDVLFGFMFTLLSVAGNLYLFLKNYSHWKQAPSPLMEAQWRLFRGKTVATVVVTLSLVPAVFFESSDWSHLMDVFGSLFLAFFMLHSSYIIITNSMSDLVDRAIDENHQFLILQSLITHEKEYLGLEKIRTRRSGTLYYVDLFLTFDRHRSLESVHESCQRIEKDLEEAFPGVDISIIPSPYISS